MTIKTVATTLKHFKVHITISFRSLDQTEEGDFIQMKPYEDLDLYLTVRIFFLSNDI